MSRDIQHHPKEQRFLLIEDGQSCVLDYELLGDLMVITHTGVPEAVGGRGIAADLTKTALETARSQGWKVRPVCSYVAAYMRRHRTTYDDLLA